MVASTELTDDVRLAHVMADDADSISMSRFKAQDLMIKTKPDSTPVTEADTAVEESIRRTLSRTRPRDAVHGEEMQDTGESNRLPAWGSSMGDTHCPRARRTDRRLRGFRSRARTSLVGQHGRWRLHGSFNLERHPDPHQ